MEAYKHGFVVKSQKELEELMGPIGSDSWRNIKGEWFDSFVDEIKKYIGKPFFGKPYVFTKKGKASNIEAWGWNFDPRWVHPFKRCTFEELVTLSIPLGKVYAVCVPSDIEERISMRGGLNVNLVPPEVAAALKNVIVPGTRFVYLRGEVGVIEFLGHLWMPDELEVLYVEQN